MKSELLKKFDSKEATRGWLRLSAMILLDLYAEENAVFGHIENGEKVPYDKYLSDLDLQRVAPLLHCEEIEGRYISRGTVTYGDVEKLYYEIYSSKVSCIFDDAPVLKESEDDLIAHYKHGLYEYLKGLYHLFREIITTEVEPEFFTAVPDVLDRAEQQAYYLQATRFIKAIRLKKLRHGGCVDRFLKGMPFISPFIRRLIVKRKGRFFLKNNDTDSLDYKLALLSCFRFYNEDNAKLFELKILRWEELKNAGQEPS